MVLKFLYWPRHLNCGWKIDKSNKKSVKEKKAHAEDRTQTSSGVTAKFKFISQVSHKQRHPHPLMQILIDAAQYWFNRNKFCSEKLPKFDEKHHQLSENEKSVRIMGSQLWSLLLICINDAVE